MCILHVLIIILWKHYYFRFCTVILFLSSQKGIANKKPHRSFKGYKRLFYLKSYFSETEAGLQAKYFHTVYNFKAKLLNSEVCEAELIFF
jgi:hypothetical protein